MIEFLDAQSWRSLVSGKRELFFDEEDDFVNAVSQSFSLKPQYITYQLKQNLVASIIVYTKGNAVVVPAYFLYTSLWIDNNLNDHSYCKHISLFLKTLLRHFNKINFNLPPSIKDVRPFVWNGFEVKNKYTYYKNLGFSTYHPNLKRIMAKKTDDYRFSINEEWVKVWKVQGLDLRSFGLSKHFVDKAISSFKYLQQHKQIITFNIGKNNELISSIIAFVDYGQKKAYFPLIGKVSHEFPGASTYLYDYAFTQLKNKEILSVDLCGANIESIALFKSKLGVDLVHYFQVDYSRNSSLIKANILHVKKALKYIVRLFT